MAEDTRRIPKQTTARKTAVKKPADGKTAGAKAAGRTGAKKSAARKTTTTAKKTASTFRISTEEKELIRNYRKCAQMQQQMIQMLTAKAAEGDGLAEIARIFGR